MSLKYHPCRSTMFHYFYLVLLISLIYSQSIDPQSMSDRICLSDSVDNQVNGIYYYYTWDADINASIYYNSQTNTYLYPWIDTSAKYYFVSPDHTQAVGSYCRLPITNDTTANPSDCLHNYNEQWQTFNGTQFVNDKDLRFLNCNDICASGNYYLPADGTYKWLHFSRTTKSSVYQCTDCLESIAYLYGWVFSSGLYKWRIGPDYTTSSAWSYCSIGYIQDDKYIFNLEDCGSWYGVYGQYEDLTLQKCMTSKCFKQTPFYGGSGTNILDVSKQEKITGISSWGSFMGMGYPYYKSLSNFSWISSDVRHTVGSALDITSCNSFVLDVDDYIHGYRILHNTFVYGLQRFP
eukprot:960293_1